MKQEQILFQCIRGSHSHGLATEQSDTDTTSIYIKTQDELLSLSDVDYVADEKNDNNLYEIEKVIRLLMVGDPNMLEMLFVPEDCVLYKNPLIEPLFKVRDMFLTKKVLDTLSGYARSQIYKARGLNKKITNPVTERKTPLDFCYTFHGQGTVPIAKWLQERGLKQIYCGLNHLPNMNQMYGVYYDWGQHLHMEFKTKEEFTRYCIEHRYGNQFLSNLLTNYGVPTHQHDIGHLIQLYDDLKPKGYHGIMKESGTSNDVHLDSIIKGDTPICYLSYNKDGYSSHCRQYKEYKEWEQKRNPVRYQSNLMKNYDAKNIMHCIRLLTMACELAETGEFNVVRKDREYLLDIKNHKYEYEQILEMTNSLMKRLEQAKSSTTLPDTVDQHLINQLLIDIRKSYYNIK